MIVRTPVWPKWPQLTRSRNGSALLAVFWVVASLGFLTFTTLALIVNSSETQFTHTESFEADLLLERGLALATHHQIKPGDPLLSEQDSLEITVESEAARFHLNTLLLAEDQIVLPRIFREWGLDLEQSAALTAALHDWIDEDDFVRLSGAERETYADAGFSDRPFNRPFQSLDEVALVRGMEQVETDWRSWLTVWSRSGKLDVNDAPAAHFVALCDCSIEAAESFVAYRNGSDSIPNTLDDPIIQTVEEVTNLVGAPIDESFVTFNEPTFRVSCIARLESGFARKREVVLNRGSGSGQLQLFHWEEHTIQ